MCPGLGFRVSALNRVCSSVRLSNILLARRLSDMWLDGRAEGRWVLSLTHKHKWGGEFSLTHTHTHSNQEVNSHSLTHWNWEVSSHSHTEIGRWVLTHTHTKMRRWVLTHSRTQIRRWFLTHSNEKVSSQSLTHPRSFTCVNGFTYLCLHMIFKNSPLFMSMSNLIQINIYFMAREKKWDSFKMKVVIIKGRR